MSVPYYRFYPTDFEADTAHLTLVEDGAYNRLLRLCWMTPGCSLPDDEAWIFRRCRARTDEEKEAIRVVLDEFFQRENQRVFNKRLSGEFDHTQRRRDVASENGAKGGRPAKALKTNETGKPNGLANRKLKKANQNQNQNHTKKEANASSKRGSRLPENWVLPSDWGEWASTEGWPETVIRLEADKFGDYWRSAPGQKGVKLDWKATWRNWMRNCNQPRVVSEQSDPVKRAALIAEMKASPIPSIREQARRMEASQ